MNNKHNPPLILASSSPYRKQLLARFGLAFTTFSPKIDEQIHENETPSDLVMRLAREKAKAIFNLNPESVVIGSDQVAVCGKKILNKPGEHQLAALQLAALSGNRADFLTGLCVIDDKKIQEDYVIYSVNFRKLNKETIENYLNLEKPYDCAGSFKSEGLGITLLSSMYGQDPTALIGLPLIRLSEMLRNCGYNLP